MVTAILFGWPLKRNLLDDLGAFTIDHVEGAVGLVAYIDTGAVGSEIDSVRRLDAFDLLDDLIRRGVDDMNAVAGGVGYIDADHIRAYRRSDKGQERSENKKEPQIFRAWKTRK